MKILNIINRFYDKQNKILAYGGLISLLLILTGYFNLVFFILGSLSFIATLLICDIRVTYLKKRLNKTAFRELINSIR